MFNLAYEIANVMLSLGILIFFTNVVYKACKRNGIITAELGFSKNKFFGERAWGSTVLL